MRILLIVAGLAGLMIAGQAVVGLVAPKEGGRFDERVIRVTREVPAPEAPLIDARGGETTLAAWRGEVAVVTLWATWCSVCLIEMPKLEAMAERYDGRGLSIVAVSVDTGEDAAAKVRAHFEAKDYRRLPQLMDPDHLLAAQVGMTGTPTTIVVDRFGQVVGAFVGLAPWADEATHLWLEALLTAESPEASRLLLAEGKETSG